MLQITDSAAKRLKKVLAEYDTREDICLRLGETREGLGLAVDRPRPDDTAVTYDDEVLLVMNATTAGQLDGHTMDFDESTKQLVFT